ncbi:hypothetical protein K493DRAFT_315728 [Basidiobolus meristosporus CBS 931.73]|uniref:Uncharacterized protein n=1 Tax=Basidiobolus meristosporus CBS 931.73 TaxID=1314790 RepID=A0A1Y1Y7E8_9FUNG|nr:hypothetical protein K493DRAFT_315728 [Basidiobolus meristosporus CBS 931.73]|eukprot:ORX93941.1 hypothetical protein K493DRAFT_315728 [Basidiobolus meristosporus CBS 931.73]
MQDPVREKRCTAIKILREIELDFAKLRQRLYREKVAELNKEIAYIRDDTHPSLTLLLQPIELKKRQRVAVADYLKNMQMLTITNMCTAMEYQISCDHQEKQKELKNSIAEGIGSKKIKLLHEWTLPDDVLHLDPHERPILSRRPRLKGTNLTTRNLAKSMVLASLEQSEIDHDLAILSGLGSF